MRGMVRVKRRLALAAVAAALVVLALPATASAHVKTKIVTVSRVVADCSVKGAEVTTPTVRATLRRKTSSGYRDLSGWVRCYFIDPDTGARIFVGKQFASHVAFDLPQRGAYLLMYSKTKTYAASSARTSRADDIGLTVGTTHVKATADADPAFRNVEVTCDISWNDEAYAGHTALLFVGAFTSSDDPDAFDESSLSRSVMLMRYLDGPESVRFTLRLPVGQVLPWLMSASVVAPADETSYIVTHESGDEPSFTPVE